MKSGGSSGAPPNIPQPQGANVTPYGQSPAHFNPQFRSYLPEDPMASAQLGDPVRQEYGDRTPLLEQQQQANVVKPPVTDATGMRALLAKMLMQHERQRSDALDGGYFSGTNAQRQAILRANRRYPSGGSGDRASGGSAASGSFGGGGGSGGLW